MATDKDAQLMHNIGLVAEGIKNIAARKEQAYIEWLRADHDSLARKVKGLPPSRYVEDKRVEKRTKYEELAAYYDERLASGLAWIKANA